MNLTIMFNAISSLIVGQIGSIIFIKVLCQTEALALVCGYILAENIINLLESKLFDK